MATAGSDSASLAGRRRSRVPDRHATASHLRLLRGHGGHRHPHRKPDSRPPSRQSAGAQHAPSGVRRRPPSLSPRDDALERHGRGSVRVGAADRPASRSARTRLERAQSIRRNAAGRTRSVSRARGVRGHQARADTSVRFAGHTTTGAVAFRPFPSRLPMAARARSLTTANIRACERLFDYAPRSVAPSSPLTALLPGFEPAPAAVRGAPRQQSLTDLGTPLVETTFVVVDLETTGGSANTDAITEIGALKLRGGELLGRLESLVNPGVPIPPMITVLTGITESMVLPAPRIAEILPPFLEFARDAVIVGHNIRFDCAFLDAALVANGYPRLSNRRVDTLALARRLVRDEIPNLRLHTLARHFRTSVEPTHRAYADAAATAEVLHSLLERAASYGVLGLDDLLALPSMRAHPSAAKLALTARLPRAPGVYVFRDRDGRVLYVGKATNLRARVRSYFVSDDRRKVPQLLRELATIDHRVCATAFEAEIRELRLIQRLQPRFNRHGKSMRASAYLKLTDERFPRLTVTRHPAPDGSGLGPFHSATTAQLVREAIESAVPLRRCATRVGRRAAIV